MTETYVAEIKKNDREVIRISRELKDDRARVHLREWFRAEDGKMRPGAKGITIAKEHVAAVIGAILTAGTRP